MPDLNVLGHAFDHDHVHTHDDFSPDDLTYCSKFSWVQIS